MVNTYDIEKRAFYTGRGRNLLDILTFGAEVDVCMGYGDARSMPRIVSGVITEITTNYPESPVTTTAFR